MKTEIWKDIIGYEGLYQVSNLGNIKSLIGGRWGKNKGIILSPCIEGVGYYQVCLTKNSCSKKKKIHRLVAMAFLLNIDNKPDVNHKNGIKTDNRLDNLEWVTKSENEKHKYNILGNKGSRYGKIGEKNPNNKKIQQFDSNGNFIKTWISAKEVERNLGIYGTCITRVCKGKRKTTGGFIWKYFNN